MGIITGLLNLAKQILDIIAGFTGSQGVALASAIVAAVAGAFGGFAGAGGAGGPLQAPPAIARPGLPAAPLAGTPPVATPPAAVPAVPRPAASAAPAIPDVKPDILVLDPRFVETATYPGDTDRAK